MDAGSAFQIIALLLLGGAAYAFFFRVAQKREERERQTTYYRRLVTDLRNAERHFEEKEPQLAELLGLDEIAARQLLEDVKFASRGLTSYDPSELYYVTEEEADRIRALTTELMAADSTIEACQEAAMAGSNSLPALHEDLMRRVRRITAEAGAIRRRLKVRAEDYYWS